MAKPRPKKDYGDGERPGKEPPLAVAVHRRKDPEQQILECVERIEPGCDLEPIARAYGLLQAVKRMHEALSEAVDEAVAEKVRVDGPFVLGEDKFYVGKKKTTKPKVTSLPLYDRLMAATDGSIEEVLDCLSANAWKHGAVRTLLEEHGAASVFDELFETKEEDEVKTGKPTKKDGVLQRIPVSVLKRLQS